MKLPPRFVNISIGLLSALMPFFVAAASVTSLGGYNVKPEETTVSGISSGAYMAVQLAVSNSSLIKGVGAVAGGPYLCAQGKLTTAMSTCEIGTPEPDPAALIGLTNASAAAGEIDPVSGLAKQKVWLFSGYNDGVVKRTVTDALYAFYKGFTAENNIFYKTNLNAAHSQVTAKYGQACNKTAPPYINNCKYDAAGMILQHLYGSLNPKTSRKLSGSINAVSQSEFYSGETMSIGMAHEGYAYVPAACSAQQPCRLHIAFHGCKQNAQTIGSDYYRHAGYNEWADANNMIVLYPETVGTQWTLATPLNPGGCWDFWGYNNADYAKKTGLQIATIRAMIDRVTSKYSGWNGTPTGVFSAPKVSVPDNTDTRVDLNWFPVADASGYSIYRATCAACDFAKLNAVPIIGYSFGDLDLKPKSPYFYKVRAVDATGNESSDSNVVSKTTAAVPRTCDAYQRDNLSHWTELRADMVLGIDYAKGSGQPMGFGTPLVETTLRQTKPGYFKIGPCT